MAASNPRYLKQAKKRLGTVFPQMRTTGTYNFPDEEYSFQVESGKITTFKAEDVGNLFRSKFNFHATGEYVIKKNTLVKVWGNHSDGSGVCTITEDGEPQREYHIYKDVDWFARAVKYEASMAPS
ncbi:MAG: hypothetical protein KDJ35_02180 [Alphaproteobacteria bacterium]|nr:hypothetical protein [Alphaproteobacteria bacterium]